MQSAGAKRHAADDLLEAERPEETALRPGNENVHILVEAERIAADRKEDGSPEARDEKVAAAPEAAQLREQAARAGAATAAPRQLPPAPARPDAHCPLPGNGRHQLARFSTGASAHIVCRTSATCPACAASCSARMPSCARR
ncbi:hypothetical protein [Streptomyces sp. SID5614]|uniref:hypothetical protein n=1 Tax=Streptomyces sp. SID5614 TaxID=2690306 RepID=UPI00136EF0D7|nr:hypothetical protein [Streptomyces sp. SID5614]MZG07115.1 hypothetical protein [Streptomyces sp. SID5614]